MYEVLDDERKFHLDIEFPDMGIDENNKIICSISKLLIIGFRKINMKITKNELNFTKVAGIGESGTFKGVKKMSYHIILNNGCYFKSVQDIKHFILFLYEIAKKRDFLNCLETELGFVIDVGIYTKNRLFKLPYQSKSGSTRVHTPSSKRQQNISFGIGGLLHYR